MKPLDFQAINDAPVTVVVGDRVWQFPVLTRKQLAVLASRWLAKDRAALLEAATQCGTDGDSSLSWLRTLQHEARTAAYIVGKCRELEAQGDILAASLKDSADVPVPPLEMIELCLRICGLYQDDDADAEAEAGDGDNAEPE